MESHGYRGELYVSPSTYMGVLALEGLSSTAVYGCGIVKFEGQYYGMNL